MQSFKEIQFGFASAEKESSRSPDLLINGFIDFEDACEKALNSDEYLFLGYKGSGKTAIGKRIALEARGSSNLFNSDILLGDFPFTSFSKIIRGGAEPESKYPTAWAWLLLLYVFRSLDRDAALTSTDLTVWQKSVSALKAEGMLSGENIASLVKKTTRKGFKVGIDKVATFEQSTETKPVESDISIYVDTLKEIIRGISTPNKHLITIDGFDDIVTKRTVQLSSIGGLVFEAGRLNEFFHDIGLSVKVIILCRTDIFERVTNANKNKSRQDYAVELDWYHDPREPQRSRLIEIANTRASLSLKHSVDVFREFFPTEIDWQPAQRVLLDMTRYTPRDFIQLMSHIQKFSEAGQRLTDDQVKSGMRDYSIKYFLPEIRDELDGYCSAGEIQAFVRSASRLKKRELGYIEIMGAMRDEGIEDKRTESLLEALYECSGIGNVSNRPSGKPFFSFKFRNRNSVMNNSDRILLHRGVWKALNIV